LLWAEDGWLAAVFFKILQIENNQVTLPLVAALVFAAPFAFGPPDAVRGSGAMR
jgi:hypothetical protein